MSGKSHDNLFERFERSVAHPPLVISSSLIRSPVLFDPYLQILLRVRKHRRDPNVQNFFDMRSDLAEKSAHICSMPLMKDTLNNRHSIVYASAPEFSAKDSDLLSVIWKLATRNPTPATNHQNIASCPSSLPFFAFVAFALGALALMTVITVFDSVAGFGAAIVSSENCARYARIF